MSKAIGYQTVVYEPVPTTPESAAHRAINEAVRSGGMVQQLCEICGAGRAVAHHDDYMKPYDVRWLCLTHHRLHHEYMKKYNDYIEKQQ